MSAAQGRTSPFSDPPPANPAPERTPSLRDVVQDEIMTEGATINSGLPFPSAIGNANVIPGVDVSSAPTLNEKQDGASGAATASGSSPTKPGMVPKRSSSLHHPASAEKRPTAPSSSGSSDEKTTKAAATGAGAGAGSEKKKKGGFFARKKKKDEDDKKGKQKEEEAETVPPVSFLGLYRYATWYEKTFNLIGIIFAIAAGAAQPLMTLIFGRLTQSFTEFSITANNVATGQEPPSALQDAQDRLRSDSGNNALYLMAIGIGMFLTTWMYMYIWSVTGEINAKRIREKYLASVLKQEVAFFDDLGAGEVATRIQNDCHLVQDGSAERVPIAASFVATFITGFVLAYARSWRLALALSSILPVIMVFGALMFVVMTKISTKSLEAVAKGGTLAEEVVGSIRTVQAFGTTAVLGEKYRQFILKSDKQQKKGSPVEGGGLGIMFFSIYSAYALAFFFGGILVSRGQADSGIVVNVFFSIIIGSFSLAMLAPELQAISKAQGAAAKLYQTIDRIPSIDSSSPDGVRLDHVKGVISFENVKFHYPSRPNVPILRDYTATFEAGQTVALVGASGSGKSTIVALTERFYDPISGVVRLDGHDIKTLNVKWLRQQIGLVSQEPTLFATSVRGNVEHGLIGSKWEDAPDAERFELVKKACIDANCHDFILKLPDGYDTNVGERGMLLSGGQKQRVAIARAIVSDPKILLLDEATSALDTQSEGVVQDALDKAAQGRTTITIAHRLSTIKDADMILVMGGGEILEAGTHNSLLADPQGAYAQLVSNQKLNQVATQGQTPMVESPEDEMMLKRLESPKSEKFPGLGRATTGRSLASAAMEDVQNRRAEEEADEDRIQSQWKLYYRLLRFNKDQKWFYLAGTIGGILSGMVYPCIAIVFGYALSDFQIQDTQELRSRMRQNATWFFIIAILAAIAIVFQAFCFSRAGISLNTKLRTRAFHSVLRHDIEWFDEDKNSTGAVTANLAEDPQKVQGLFGPTMGTVIQSITTLIGGCIIGLIYGPLLALIGIATIPLLVSGGYIRLKVVVLKDRKLKKIHAKSAHMASEAAGAVRTVAALTREDDIGRIYSAALEEPLRVSFKGGLKSQCLYAASQGISFLIIALVFYVGCLWLIDGRYQTNQFFTVLTSVVFAALQAGNVFNFVPDASKAGSSAQALFRLFDNEPEIDALSTEGIKLETDKVEGHIKLEGIHFRYPTRPGVRVLRELDVDVPPGTFVALVGPSGCGKSTTVQMIERFYDPLIGRVTLDGIDIKDLNVASYRKNIALVSQEPTLYAGTVRFNVTLGASKPADQVTEEEVVQACKDANIYDFVMSLPDGFDTEVGGKGSQLSGGQKQRIAIARALIRNPKILLLDEATSALDSQSERVVQDALDRASKGRTTIAIAHRLSTIQKADIIYCFAEGKVAEKGTHGELLAKKGAYYDLVQMQNLSQV